MQPTLNQTSYFSLFSVFFLVFNELKKKEHMYFFSRSRSKVSMPGFCICSCLGWLDKTALWNTQSGSLAAASGCWSRRSFVGLEHQLACSLRGGNLSHFPVSVLWHETGAVLKTTTWSVQMTLSFRTASVFLSATSLSHCPFLSVCAQFFSEYEKLLLSENYVTKRQSLKVRTTGSAPVG